MKSVTQLACLYLLLFACTPQNEEVTEEQIDTKSTEEVVDTLANTRQDAVNIDENNQTLNFPIPPAVTQLVADRYVSWQEPSYTENVLQQAENNTQGPGTIRGDFNGDNQQDYAMQFQQQRQVVIVAIMSESNGNWQLHELKKDILFNDRGELKSPYLLSLTESGEKLQHPETRKQVTTPYNAITLNLDGDEAIYLYENGQFEAYQPVN